MPSTCLRRAIDFGNRQSILRQQSITFTRSISRVRSALVINEARYVRDCGPNECVRIIQRCTNMLLISVSSRETQRRGNVIFDNKTPRLLIIHITENAWSSKGEILGPRPIVFLKSANEHSFTYIFFLPGRHALENLLRETRSIYGYSITKYIMGYTMVAQSRGEVDRQGTSIPNA
ncbi:hypothetical protein PUN28_019933 [Cardiocondyla obscurior]|uniref:Uncharacterized protein n=1 Tax=Cardiocondyla obscurior TaxID=286306 RepID=A0AAW2EC31_9HYME